MLTQCTLPAEKKTECNKRRCIGREPRHSVSGFDAGDSAERVAKYVLKTEPRLQLPASMS